MLMEEFSGSNQGSDSEAFRPSPLGKSCGPVCSRFSQPEWYESSENSLAIYRLSIIIVVINNNNNNNNNILYIYITIMFIDNCR